MKVKGSALRSTMSFLREQYPAPTVARILAGLPEEDRKILTPPILTSAWFPADALCRLIHGMEKETPGDPQDLYLRVGMQSCEDGLNTIYKLFFKVGTPSFILKHAGQVWKNYYDEGQIVLVSSTSNTAHVRLEGAKMPDPAMCMRISGWMKRAAELSGGHSVAVDHCACVHRGAPACEWKTDWA
jgi:hypothetical protein